MQIYLVGGAVRDELLGLPIKEKDWVVIGETPETMQAQGFKPVGKDFPVFLHPETREEYALARTERKTGKGYKGFVFHADPSVTLVEDLKRRDLTINAIAKNIITGEIIDPFDGITDLKEKNLHHVSPAFAEDPVRILRIARFLARLSSLGFSIHPDTLALMKKMVAEKEVHALVPERVCAEMLRALDEKNPECFFTALQACDAMPILFPELVASAPFESRLFEDTSAIVRFSLLFYKASRQIILSFSNRYRIPANFVDLALAVNANWQKLFSSLNATEIFNLFKTTDAFRHPARFSLFLEACEQIAFQENKTWDIHTVETWRACLALCASISYEALPNKSLSGKAIGEAIDAERIKAISGFLSKK